MAEIKWGLTGCGDISRRRVAPGLIEAEGSRLISVNRSDFSKAEEFAKEFGAEKWFKDWKEMIVDRDINAMYIGTPVHLHSEQAIAAAEAGKHVLCEKPMAMNTAEADKMIDACRANGVKLGIAYYRNLYPAIKRIKEIIESGELGQITHIQSNNFTQFNRQPGEPRSWLLDREKSGGGPMMDMGCHRIEVFLNLLGDIESVSAFNKNLVYEREVEDNSTALFQFKSGAEGILTSSHAASEPRDTLEIYGTGGSIHVPVLNEGTLHIWSPSGSRTEKYPNPENVHKPLIEDFISAVNEDRNPAVTGEAGREVSRILDMIYKW